MNLDFLRPLYDQPGPWASVSLDASHETPDAASARALHWRSLRATLVDQGADDAVLRTLDTAVDALPPRTGRWGAVLLARASDPAHVETFPHPPLTESATWSMLPEVAEVVRAHVNDVSWIRAVVDRTGADITTSAMLDDTVAGSEQWPLHKSGKGGWSQSRYERSVEESWDRNAAEVAEEVTRIFDRMRPDLVILAGDPDAQQLTAKRMPERVAEKLMLAPGSRGAGADNQALLEATDVAAVELVERSRQDALDRYRADAGRSLAVQGLPDVTLALRSRAVDTLFLTAPDRPDELWLSMADAQLQISPDSGELNGDAALVNAGAALIASAAVSDADLVVDVTAREHWRDGVGAVLRFPVIA
jgi:Bacterial archaeo-eukaryotic release factor family 2